MHTADIAADVDTHPFGRRNAPSATRGATVEPDHGRLLVRGLFVYDALYARGARPAPKLTLGRAVISGRCGTLPSGVTGHARRGRC